MRTVQLKKSFKDIDIENVFVFESDSSDLNIEKMLETGIASAKETVCFVLGNGLNDKLATMLLSGAARKYVIVPNIDESKYSKIRGNLIVREVDNIKGNYVIIDSSKAYFFDEKLNGYVISDANAISVLKQVFLKEFWENGQMEFIESKGKCAEITFDIPPIYGNETFLLDESFGADTSVATLLRGSDGYVFTGKIRGETSEKKIYIKNPMLNKDYLVTTNNSDVFLVPGAPCSMTLSANESYITNFDIGDYNTLPEKGKGRLFAIKCGNLALGKVYRFFRHKHLEKLVGRDVLDLNGEKLVVLEHTEEIRRVETDLRMAREYERMDPETLEARLEKKDPKIFSQTKLAGGTTFSIELFIQKRRMTKKADIYSVYEVMHRDIEQKIKEMELACIRAKKQELIKDIKAIGEKVSTVAEYIKVVDDINRLIDKINGGEDVDSALSEVVVNRDKQKIVVVHLKAKDVHIDLPANGVLYQDRDRYEYVLSSENRLDAAIVEMKAAGIENSNVAYITE